jgi:hypothetical protein
MRRWWGSMLREGAGVAQSRRLRVAVSQRVAHLPGLEMRTNGLPVEVLR